MQPKKSIQLIPTLFFLDVWEHKSENLSNDYCNYYDIFFEELPENGNFVETIVTGEKCIFQNETRITLVVKDLSDKGILIHEIIHIIFHLSKLTDLGVNWKSQEWVAYFAEYIYNEIMK